MKFVFTDKKVNLPDSVHKYAEKKVGQPHQTHPAYGGAQ